MKTLPFLLFDFFTHSLAFDVFQQLNQISAGHPAGTLSSKFQLEIPS
jgi:hypothetical protein